MQKRPDPRHPDQLLPVCGGLEGGAEADPAVRIVRALRSLGPARTALGSICSSSYDRAAATVASSIGRSLRALACR